MRSLLAIAAAMFLAATTCSTNNAIVDATGNWNYSATLRDTMPQLTCTTTGGAMQLTQTGTVVSGTYSGLAFSCTGAITMSFGPFSGNITNGTIAGSSVVITFDVTGCCGPTSNWQNTGTATNSTMQGSILAIITLNATEYTMFGNWTASKQ